MFDAGRDGRVLYGDVFVSSHRVFFAVGARSFSFTHPLLGLRPARHGLERMRFGLRKALRDVLISYRGIAFFNSCSRPSVSDTLPGVGGPFFWSILGNQERTHYYGI